MIKTASGRHLSPKASSTHSPLCLFSCGEVLSVSYCPMAREFRLLSVLWLVVACLAATTTTEDLTITTGVNTTVTSNNTATTATPTTTTVAGNNTATLTTTTVAGNNTATTATPTTTTLAGNNTATTTTTTVAGNNTATTATLTTTTVAGNNTATTATPTTTTVAGNNTATTATPTTTTVAGNNTATMTTTTVAGNNTATTATLTTTTVAGNNTATPTTTTVAGNNTATTATPTTTTVAGNNTATTATPTTTTVAGNITAATATPTTTTTTVAANVTATTATPTTTTVAGNITAATATPTTTTVAGNITAATATPTTTTTSVAANATATTATPTTTTVAGNITAATATPTNTSIAANTTSSTPVPTTKPDPCDGKPCRDGSTCEPRVNQNFTCLCLAGEYDYDLKICERAKVFPGQLGLPSLKFNENMTVKTSPEFQEASQSITNELQSVFEESDGFSGSIVLELRKLPSKVWSRSEDGVSATIEIFFKANTDISSAEVTKTIENVTECAGCLLASGSFDVTDLCDKEPCDFKTTTCASGNGSFSCKCLEDYVKTNFSDRMCIACPSGQRPDGSEECVNCQFGRSGFNCNESWQLVLVIVGSVLGGLLLITLILLPILAHKPSKKSSKKSKKSDTEKSYDSHRHAKAPLVNNSLANNQAASVNEPAHSLSAFANAGVPRIPRATSTNSWNSRTNLEMTPSNSRQNLIPMGRNPRLYDDHDDMNPYTQARPQSSLYAQARPQNNPYAQNRPQTNPYAPSQGHSNPYYMHDNGRRFN